MFFETIASRLRIAILELLMQGPKSVNEICESLNEEQSKISHNLKKLAECHFVDVQQEGKKRVYSINKETICQKVYFGFAEPAYSFIPVTSPWYTAESVVKYGVGPLGDKKKAAELFSEAGYGRKKPDGTVEVTGKDGKPYNSGQVLVAYGLDAWNCNDVLDGPEDGPKKIRAFTATPIGVAKMFAEGMTDGPLPEYYEPIESGSSNSLEHAHQTSPLARIRKIDKIASYGTDTAKKFNVIGLTYSLAEHHGTGQVTRYSRAVGEVVPAFFIEVGADLAKEKGIVNGDKVKVSSPRLTGGITGEALVTQRLNAVQKGQYMIAVPENFGFVGEEPQGMPAHDLTLMSGDPNTGTAACRTFLCSIAKA